ncbi:MAG: FKBP-type peptidyl-prolyl cis-trans isomerase [Ilumatobacteraceae bacterium]|jgi:peptidylprolyl isomerase|nr:FKBP-type peptidyl-prolyl cis-trans isomerase [Ilumatobacteraceae bacterium]
MSSRTSRAIVALILSSTLLIAACGGDDSTSTTDAPSSTEASAISDPADLIDEPTVSLPSEIPTELVITDITEGEGEAAIEGSTVYVYYVGVLSENGKRFDGNFGSDPYAVTLGVGAVIDGWDQGLIGIKAGGRRQLDIPADLAYGSAGSGDAIPPDSAISFVVDVVAIVPPIDPADAPEITIEGAENVEVLVSEDLVDGKGDEAKAGSNVLVHIIAFNGATGEELASTWGDPSPVALLLAEGGSLPGLVEGIPGMKVGGRRQLTIPFADAFGAEGNSSMKLPASTDLIVVIDLLSTF